MNHRSIRIVAATVLSAFALGCSDTDPISVPPEEVLRVTPLFIGLDPGSTQQLTATLGGQPVAVTWESSNQAVATVSATGLVTAVGSGFTAITATVTTDPAKKISSNITVVPGLVSGVAVTGLASSAPRFSGIYRFIEVPAGTTRLTVTLSGGTGDADLFLKHGSKPVVTSTTSTASHSSEAGGNTESIVVNNPTPGVWHIFLMVWDPFTGVTLRATLN